MEIHYTDSEEQWQTIDVAITDNSYRYQEIMGDNNIVLNFSLPSYVDFKVGSWLNFQNVRYTTLELGNVTKQNERWYDYTLTFESPQTSLSRYKFRSHVDGRLNFTLTAQPQEFVSHICTNMNQREGSNEWTVGDCIISGEKTQSFSHNTILDALNAIASLFETEWEIIGKRISLRKIEYNKTTALSLSYGKGNGFKSGVSRQLSGEKAVDVLWVEGGERNIDSLTYTYARSGSIAHANRLRLPRQGSFVFIPSDGSVGADGKVARGQIFTATEWANVNHSLYPDYMAVTTDEDGFGISRTAQINNGYEDSLSAEDVYPHKILTITSVTESDPSKHFWDIRAAANNVDYSQCLIAGQTASIIFQSGMLTGKEFNWSKYNHSNKQFDIVPQEIDGITMPDRSSAYYPVVGDTFAVFHVNLPSEYITEAERELLLVGCEYLHAHGEVEVEFNGTMDGIWAKQSWEEISSFIRLGGYIRFYDTALCQDGKLMRILNIKQFINNPNAPEITLSNASISQGITSELKKIPQNQVAARHELTNYQNLTERTFDTVKQTSEAIKELADKYKDYFTEGITPIIVETMQTIIGNKDLQFEFGSAGTQLVSNRYKVLTFQVRRYDPQWVNGSLVCERIQMRHFQYSAVANTVSPDTAAVSVYPYWDVAANSFQPSDPDKQYYLYAVCPKSASNTNNLGYLYNATFTLSATIKTHTSTNYYFEVGILNKELNGERSFAPLYGFTEIAGGRMSTDVIRSHSGDTVIDLINDEIKGYFNFLDGLVAGILKVGKTDQTATAGIGGYYAYWAGSTSYQDYDNPQLENGRTIYPQLPVFSVMHNGTMKLAAEGYGIALRVNLRRINNKVYPIVTADHISSDDIETSSLFVREKNMSEKYNVTLEHGDVELWNGTIKKPIKLQDNYIYYGYPSVVLCSFTLKYEGNGSYWCYVSDKAQGRQLILGEWRDQTKYFTPNNPPTRIGEGHVKITFPTKFKFSSDYVVVATGKCCRNYSGSILNNHCLFVTVVNQKVDSIELLFGDNDSPNDGDVNVTILAHKGYGDY